MTAQIQAEKVPGRVLLVGRGRVVAGRRVEVSVTGEDLVVFQALELRERVVDPGAHPLTYTRIEIRGQSKAALALEGLEVGFDFDVRIAAIKEILQAIPAAVTCREATAHPDLQPQRIRDDFADALVGTTHQLLG